MSFVLNDLIEERDELDKKLQNLNEFIVKIGNGEVTTEELACPMRLLSAQSRVMREYLEILNERILVVEYINKNFTNR